MSIPRAVSGYFNHVVLHRFESYYGLNSHLTHISSFMTPHLSGQLVCCKRDGIWFVTDKYIAIESIWPYRWLSEMFRYLYCYCCCCFPSCWKTTVGIWTMSVSNLPSIYTEEIYSGMPGSSSSKRNGPCRTSSCCYNRSDPTDSPVHYGLKYRSHRPSSSLQNRSLTPAITGDTNKESLGPTRRRIVLAILGP